MSQSVKLEDLLPVMEDVLNSGGNISFTPNGISMRPMLESGRDTITLHRFNRKLKKYALPLYRRKNGKFVLHRVVGENSKGYIMRGDNQLHSEHGIKDEQIIGEVISFTHKGKEYSCNDLSYKLYYLLRCNNFTVFIKRGINKLLRILKGK